MRSRTLPALLAAAALLVVLAVPAAAGPPSTAPTIEDYTLVASCVDGEAQVEVTVSHVGGLGVGYVAYQVDGGAIVMLAEDDLDRSYVSPTFFYEFSVAVAPGSREITTYLAYDPEVSTSSATDTVIVDDCGDTPPVCDTEANGYGRKIIDCFGAPYGQLHRDSGERPAQGAKAFWVEHGSSLP